MHNKKWKWRLSKHQKKLRTDINSTKDMEKKTQINTKRNRMMKEIHEKLEEEEIKNILNLVDEVERYNDDSRRIFQVVKELQKLKEKRKIILNGKEGEITRETKYQNHHRLLQWDGSQTRRQTTKWNTTHTNKSAIYSRINQNNNKKSEKWKDPGNLNKELIKHGTYIIHEGIAKIFNNIAETG